MGLFLHPAPWDTDSSAPSDTPLHASLAAAGGFDEARGLPGREGAAAAAAVPGPGGRVGAPRAIPGGAAALGMGMGLGAMLGLGAGEGSQEAAAGPDAGAPGVGGATLLALCESLSLQRASRELALQLRGALGDASAEWRYVRVAGLRALSRLLQGAAEDLDTAKLLRESQMYTQLQVVPVVYAHSLAPHLEKLHAHLRPPAAGGGGGGPPDHGSPGAAVGAEAEAQRGLEREVLLALHVLEGCCLLCSQSRSLALRTSLCQDISTLLLKFSQLQPPPQQQQQHAGEFPSAALAMVASVGPAGLGTLLAILGDSVQPLLQGGMFERCGVLPTVALLAGTPAVPHTLRLRAAEFLLLTGCLVKAATGRLLPYSASASEVDPHEDTAAANIPTSEVLGEPAMQILEHFCDSPLNQEPWSLHSGSALQATAHQLVECLVPWEQ